MCRWPKIHSIFERLACEKTHENSLDDYGPLKGDCDERKGGGVGNLLQYSSLESIKRHPTREGSKQNSPNCRPILLDIARWPENLGPSGSRLACSVDAA